MVRSSINEQFKCLCHINICIFSMSQGLFMFSLKATIILHVNSMWQVIVPSLYIRKMATIL